MKIRTARPWRRMAPRSAVLPDISTFAQVAAENFCVPVALSIFLEEIFWQEEIELTAEQSPYLVEHLDEEGLEIISEKMSAAAEVDKEKLQKLPEAPSFLVEATRAILVLIFWLEAVFLEANAMLLEAVLLVVVW